MLKAPLSIDPHPRAFSRFSSQASRTSPPTAPSVRQSGTRTGSAASLLPRTIFPVSSFSRVRRQSVHQLRASYSNSNSGYAMARRGEHLKAIFLLCEFPLERNRATRAFLGNELLPETRRFPRKARRNVTVRRSCCSRRVQDRAI